MNKWIRQKFMPCSPLGENHSKITGCEKHIRLSRKAACEGTVLLKNNDALLPFEKGTKIAVFGKSQIDYVKGGGGSGEVNTAYIRNIYQGLKLKREQLQVFDELSLYYQSYVEQQYRSGETPGLLKEAAVPEALLASAKNFTDAAVIVIGRFSGEGTDRKNDGTDDYFNLSETEKEMIEKVTANFTKVVVLLNVGAIIDTSWFADNPGISAAVMIWQGGMEGGLAAADVLTGDSYPSGKLADTCAVSLDDYPSSEGFHESEEYVTYTEDIFVGYRYFETVPGKKERVVYPFGYGLSYTEFSLSDLSVCDDKKNIYLSVTVTNTGNRAGKEVVQVYFNAPAGKLTKPSRQLCGFAKTRELLPGDVQNLQLSFAIEDMASFDDMGVVAKSCKVLEKGDYNIFVGTDVRSAAETAYTYTLEENQIVEELHSYVAPEKLEKRLQADGTYQTLECKEIQRETFPCVYRIPVKPEETFQLIDVAQNKLSLDTFIAQLTDEELCHLVTGQGNIGVANTCGMGNLPRVGIPGVMTADGPAGLRIKRECMIDTTAFPVATSLAASWNTDLLEEVGKAGALEVKENNLSIWLTPALNIHRSPLCGRNFEYFSEDPFLSGKMASAIVRGIQSQNIVAVPKHFACNNKETNRKNSDSVVSERALREIYLKGFEICVKEAKPKMIMTAYNLVNGVRVSENAELLWGILRNEWGFDGTVISDWSNFANHKTEVQAGNNVKMPTGEPEELFTAIAAGTLKREELCVAVKYLLSTILWLD